MTQTPKEAIAALSAFIDQQEIARASAQALALQWQAKADAQRGELDALRAELDKLRTALIDWISADGTLAFADADEDLAELARELKRGERVSSNSAAQEPDSVEETQLHRDDYPAGPSQVQGMAASASHWLLVMMDRNNMSAYEALYVAQHMLETVVNLIGREEARLEKRRRARKERQ